MTESGQPDGRSRPIALIIGVGNDYRRDDGAGVEVARRIDALNLPRVRATLHSGEGVSLVERFAEADLVVIVDAARSQSSPGTVHYFDVGAAPIPSDFFHYSSHAFSVAEAVELARTLQLLPRRLLVYGIEGKDFAAGVGLTGEVQEAVSRVVERVKENLREVTSSHLN